ncbi:hypothetical protein GCM10025782_23060 [Pedococcus ginsenosidimutans]|uniref:Glutamyl-tRNA amidotransferase n=1 Tax=Pedococcus ginsenosidimutans TaxID=490570 RepID=A0ABP8Y915_9MICO
MAQSQPLPHRRTLIRQGSRSRRIRAHISGASTKLALGEDLAEAINDTRRELLTETIIDHLSNVSAVPDDIRPRREQLERVAAYASELAAAAPPLTDEQRDRIALLMGEVR